MRSKPAREKAARAVLLATLEQETDEDLDLNSHFKVAVLARAYTIDDEEEGEWKFLLLEALDAAAAGTSTVPAAASATYDELETLQVIWKKLDGVIAARTGEDRATEHLKDARAALRRADMALRVSPSQSLHREYVVRTVTLLWCRYTGDKPTISNDAQSSGLTQTPLLRFLRGILSLRLPGLTDSEIRRGVSLAK